MQWQAQEQRKEVASKRIPLLPLPGHHVVNYVPVSYFVSWLQTLPKLVGVMVFNTEGHRPDKTDHEN